MSDFFENELPLWEMLKSHSDKEKVSFHMPGHNRAKGFLNIFETNLLAFDTTELPSTDDINNPNNSVLKSNQLASQAFGSAYTFFITTGSTIAIHAAILAFTNHNDKIIVFENTHKSVMNACIMYGLKMVITNEILFSKTLLQNNDAVLVLATCPDYYGKSYNLSSIAEQTHLAKKVLIVDEAHGTHFAFCPDLFPKTALLQGADIVIQSAHKTAPVLTQGAFLHISKNLHKSFINSNSNYDMIEIIQSSISMVTTSSPSFLIAATLDYARMYLENFGEEKYKILFENIFYIT